MKNFIQQIASLTKGHIKSNVLLPDGSGAAVISIPRRPFLERLRHKLFDCPTFWHWDCAFTCPLCGSGYRCYWDGNDSDCGAGIDLCVRCAKIHEGHKGDQCRTN